LQPVWAFKNEEEYLLFFSKKLQSKTHLKTKTMHGSDAFDLEEYLREVSSDEDEDVEGGLLDVEGHLNIEERVAGFVDRKQWSRALYEGASHSDDGWKNTLLSMYLDLGFCSGIALESWLTIARVSVQFCVRGSVDLQPVCVRFLAKDNPAVHHALFRALRHHLAEVVVPPFVLPGFCAWLADLPGGLATLSTWFARGVIAAHVDVEQRQWAFAFALRHGLHDAFCRLAAHVGNWALPLHEVDKIDDDTVLLDYFATGFNHLASRHALVPAVARCIPRLLSSRSKQFLVNFLQAAVPIMQDDVCAQVLFPVVMDTVVPGPVFAVEDSLTVYRYLAQHVCFHHGRLCLDAGTVRYGFFFCFWSP
jgi:hypothetical protein